MPAPYHRIGSHVSKAFRERFEPSVCTGTDVASELGVPYLGSVPLLSSVLGFGDEETAPADYLRKRPVSVFSESLRALLTTIQISPVGQKGQVTAVTSALPGEGKTTTAVCLALSGVQAGLRVVIVDCDLRRRALTRLFQIETGIGLLEALNDSNSLESALHHDAQSEVHVLPLPQACLSTDAIFVSLHLDNLIARMRDRFDLIILDTAPLLAVAETGSLAAKADSVVLLARWRATPRKTVASSLNLLEAAGADVAGVALVQVGKQKTHRHYRRAASAISG